MSEQVLVLGGSGFIGSALVAALTEDGQQVEATYCSRRPTTPDTAWHQLDVRDREAVFSLIDGYTTVYHLAGVGLQEAPPATVHSINTLGTKNVVEACLENGIDRFVFSSTAGTRRADDIATEADRAKPIGAYQAGKAQAEAVVDGAVTKGLSSVTVHPTAVIGPDDTNFTTRLLAMATRPSYCVHPPGGANFVAVDTVVDGIRRAKRLGTDGSHYLLGGENVTYREAIDRIATHIDGTPPLGAVPAPLVHAAGPIVERINSITGRSMFPFTREMAKLSTEYHFYSSRNAVRDLGYEPSTLESAIEPAWEWYRSTSESV